MPEKQKKKTSEQEDNLSTEEGREKYIHDFIEDIYTNKDERHFGYLETPEERINRLIRFRENTIRHEEDPEKIPLQTKAIDQAIERAKKEEKEEKQKKKESKKKFGIGFSGFFNRKSENEIKEAEEREAQGQEVRLEEMAKGNRWEREALRLEQEAHDERKQHEKKLKNLVSQLEQMLKESGENRELQQLVEKAKENLYKLENINTTHHEIITRGQNSTRTNLLAEIKRLKNYLTEVNGEISEEKWDQGPRFWNKEDELRKTGTKEKSTPPPISTETIDDEMETFKGETEITSDEPQDESERKLLEEIDDEKLFDNDYYTQFLTKDYIVFPTTEEEKENLKNTIKRLEKEGKQDAIQKMVATTYSGSDPEMDQLWKDVGAGEYLTKIQDKMMSADVEQRIEGRKEESNTEDILKSYTNYETQLQEENTRLLLPISKISRAALQNLIKTYTKKRDDDDISVENYDKLVHAIARGYDKSQKDRWIELGAEDIIERIEERELIPEKELTEQEKIENEYYQKFVSGEPITLPSSNLEKMALKNVITELENEGNQAMIVRMITYTYNDANSTNKQIWVDVGAGKYLQKIYEKILNVDAEQWVEGKKAEQERKAEERDTNEAIDSVRHKRNYKEIIQGNKEALVLPYSKPAEAALKEIIRDYQRNKEKNKISQDSYNKLVHAIARGYDKSQKDRWIQLGAEKIIEQIEKNNLPKIDEEIPEIPEDELEEVVEQEKTTSTPPPTPEIAKTEADIKERKEHAIQFLKDQPFASPTFKDRTLIPQEYNKTPELQEKLFKAERVVIGDLHASARKLVEGCIASGLIEFPSTAKQAEFLADYAYFIDNKRQRAEAQKNNNTEEHRQLKETAESVMQKFNETLEGIKWTGEKRKLVLIGDTIFDRGYSDSVMVRLINHLRGQGADITVLSSNHDFDFYDGKNLLEQDKSLRIQDKQTQANSGHDDIYPLSEDEYKEYLKQTKLFDYDPKEKIFYAHAYQTQDFLDLVGTRINTPATPENIEEFVKKANEWYAEKIQKLESGNDPNDNDIELLRAVIWGYGYRNPLTVETGKEKLKNIILNPAFDNKVSIICGHDNELEKIRYTIKREQLNAISLNDVHQKIEVPNGDKKSFRIFAS